MDRAFIESIGVCDTLDAEVHETFKTYIIIVFCLKNVFRQQLSLSLKLSFVLNCVLS